MFTERHGPVCAQHGCEYDVVETAMASSLAERVTSWKQSLARKWGTSDVAGLDILGRSAGPTVLQIAGEARGWSKVDTDGPLEKTRISGRLETEVSTLETTGCGCVLERRSCSGAVVIAMELGALVENEECGNDRR